jgi:tRNA threonylcarbamoyladenosine biosynthesis protein TsaB
MILLIDTSQETGTVALSSGGRLICGEENKVAKEHASWLHMAARRLTEKAHISIREIEAVSVMAGPGSYTGLRVGFAAAKGFCFGLKIPLITQNTLRVMAESMKSKAIEKKALVCPMIDARRDEVFTAIYDFNMTEIMPPRALILDKNSFDYQLSVNSIIFFGSGAEKWNLINSSGSAIFELQISTIQAFIDLSTQDARMQKWADPIYAEPVYLKEFFSY